MTQNRAPFWILAGEQLERRWGKVLDWDMRHSRLVLKRLEQQNRSSTLPVTEPSGPIVSLTTYSKRIHTVYFAIESIAAGRKRASRLILWLDDEQLLSNLPDSVKRLQDRGLEVRQSANYGPHTKYYPYLLSTSAFHSPLVTADDDTIYPSDWLEGLQQACAAHPEVIACYRAHEMRFSADGFRPYAAWGRCRSNLPSFHHFLTGVSGCIYPPHFVEKLKAAGTGFQTVCPKADDVWLHACALRFGFKIRQIQPWQRTFPLTPETQDIGLAVTNVHASQNDAQISATYTKQEVAFLQSVANRIAG